MKTIISAITMLFAAGLLTACSSTNNRTYDGERCKELSKKAEELRGKPIRRSAAVDQYNLECTKQY